MAAGVMGDALVMAIEEIEIAQMQALSSQSIDEQAENRRTRDRERKAAIRQLNKNVPQTSADSADITDKSTPSDGFSDSSLTPPPSPKEKPPKGVKKKIPLPLPEWVPAEEWKGFEEMRVKIGKPMTDAARKLAFNRLDKFRQQGYSPHEVLNHCTLNCYQGIFKPKEDYETTGRNNKNTNSGYAENSPRKSLSEQIHDQVRAAGSQRVHPPTGGKANE